MSKASLKLQPVGYPVYRAMAQLNRSFEDCIENLNHLMSFNLLDPDNLRTYEVMVEEVRALVNQNFGDLINVVELENATYFENLRLKWQQQQLAKTERAVAGKLEGNVERPRLLQSKGHKDSQRNKAVRP